MKKRPKSLDKPSTTKIMKWMSTANVWIFLRTGGRLGKKFRIGAAFPRGVPICLLTTTGRKSGQPRTVPLLYLPDADAVVLVASQGGAAKNPLWYGNLVAEPRVEIRIGRTGRQMIARTASADERARLWPRLVALYSDFENYQSWTEREIPVVICQHV